MAMTNLERVGKGLQLLKEGLAPFVEREMNASYKKKWLEMARTKLHHDEDIQVKGGKIEWDAHVLLILMWEFWHTTFKRTLGHAERTYVSELRTVRNNWAHQRAFSSDDAQRALDSMQRLLTAVSAEQATEIDNMRKELMRRVVSEQSRTEFRKLSLLPTEGAPKASLKPWREIITPHPDVSMGRYQQAEFAADLAQVHRGEASTEYGDPEEFFRRTYLTEGLGRLLKDSVRRICAQEAEPIVDLQTNFGGGKTHSMLALYHLLSGVAPASLSGMEEVLKELDIAELPSVNRVVLVGTALSPGQSHTKPDGTEVHTMWGELAWQLGEEEGYDMVADADRTGTNPGSEILLELLRKYGPCLILIDEWVAFVRQLWGKEEALPAGSFDANLSFAQSLGDATKSSDNSLMVASLPASDIEIGGEGGQQGLAVLKNTVFRQSYPWRPATSDEAYEIVRRRLFEPITDSHDFAARDAVIESFSRLYQSESTEFPSEAREGEYKRKMEAAYPVHPELFRRLNDDWGSLERFQRTRGVLRLMASVIHDLWERSDASLLIMPGNIPVDSPPVQQELTRYLEDHWVPVIEKDVDGPNSLPLSLDRENPSLGRYSACRRVARAIFLGSAPTAQTAHPGLDDRAVRLSCVQPGETVATFGDALRRLTDRATHLYVDGNRYWLMTQPSVAQLARDRADQQDIHVVWEEFERRLKSEKQRGDFARVHVAPESSADVPDEMEARLVILGPGFPHARGGDQSEARSLATEILNNRGTSPRLYRNMLVFLAADRSRLTDVEQSIRQYLAWKSIVEEEEALNLNAFARNQARTKQQQADETIGLRTQECYQFLLIPNQSDPKESVEWAEIRASGQQPLAVRASKKLVNEEHLITQFSATRLQMELDKYLWKDVDHIGLKKLWEYLAQYLYLPRLKDSTVLAEAVQEGFGKLTWSEHFAYAEAWDEAKERYIGLKAGQLGSLHIDSQSVVVKPDVAQIQIDQDSTEVVGPTPPDTGDEDEPPGPEPPEKPKLTRFYGSVQLDPIRLNRDVGSIADEVVQHLTSHKGSQVEVSLEIQAKIPDGAPDDMVRTVAENCRTLKFNSQAFEEE